MASQTLELRNMTLVLAFVFGALAMQTCDGGGIV
jgi:hypothetical protein